MSGIEQKELLVFLSHASEDKAKVLSLCKRLKEDGFDPWLDEERLLPGQDWNLEIEKALHASGAILLCFSTLSVTKEGYIQREYKHAMKIQEEKPEGAIFVIPVRLDDCEMPFFIRELQWVDYPASYDRLVMALRIKLGGIAMPKKTLKSKPKKPASKRSPVKPAGRNFYNIQGNVHIGRDMIAGNQTNVYYQNQQTLNITSPAQFIDELQKLKGEIDRLKSQPSVDSTAARSMAVVQADIQDAIEEVAKDKPSVEHINKTLDSAKETMEKLSGSITTAVNLGTTLGNLALLSMKLFGG